MIFKCFYPEEIFLLSFNITRIFVLFRVRGGGQWGWRERHLFLPKNPSGPIDNSKDLFVQRCSVPKVPMALNLSSWTSPATAYPFEMVPWSHIDSCHVSQTRLSLFASHHMRKFVNLIYHSFSSFWTKANKLYSSIYWFNAEFPFLRNSFCSSWFHLLAVILLFFKSFLIPIKCLCLH